jgi:glycosyltransferase involved in cell wall biosynthesis
MFLSLIIPAYNESKRIAHTIRTAQEALAQVPIESYEIVVADDDSTDDTAFLAEGLGARVVKSGKRNIGATRNAGAAAARGTHFLFVDADTLINPAVLRAMCRAFARGAAAGGAQLRWSGPAPFGARFCLHAWNLISRVTRLPAGSFLFATREAFERSGGFNEELFITEELDLGRRLKKVGTLVILRETYLTSPRKTEEFSQLDHVRLFAKLLRNPQKTVRNQKLLDIWYIRRDS